MFPPSTGRLFSCDPPRSTLAAVAPERRSSKAFSDDYRHPSFSRSNTANTLHTTIASHTSYTTSLMGPPTITTTSTARASRVLIAGGGFGAVFLALLLERLNVPYYLFDGAGKVKHLSAAMSIGPNVLPVFEQLGVANLLASISMPCPDIDIFDQNLKRIGTLPIKTWKQSTGYDEMVCARIHLYESLLAQLNPDNIVMHKKILSYEENELGVNVCCSDNSIYCGDILVGADGAQSRIRQGMHKILRRKNQLSRNDRDCVVPHYVSVAGVAQGQSSEKYPCLKDPFVHFTTVVGSKGMGWHAINIPDDQICWAMWLELDPTEAVTDSTNTESSEHGLRNTEPIANRFRKQRCPLGGTMGELLDSTEERLKSKIYIGEKLFDTWYHGRTVLLGDACHSMLPWSAQCETNEIMDAVILANAIFELKDLGMRNISRAFKEYYNQRYPLVRTEIQTSRSFTRLVCGQSLRERLMRYVSLHWVPPSYQRRSIEVAAAYRPQASFMAQAEMRGSAMVHPQRSNKRWTEDEVSKRVSVVWGLKTVLPVH